MEHEEDYKLLLVIVKELEQCTTNGDYLDRMKMNVRQSIEIEFEKCVKALAARKQALLNEIELKFQDEKKHLDTKENNTGISIKGCKELLQAGATIYPVSKEAAVKAWKSGTELKPKSTGMNLIYVNFSTSFWDCISKHGSVATTTEYVSFSSAGMVSTFAGSYQGNVDESGVSARFSTPYFGCFNSSDNCFYVSDYSNHTIRKITDHGEVSTFAARSGDGQVSEPLGIAAYHKENCFFVCSYSQHMIKKISSSGTITTLAGSGNAGSLDGISTKASFRHPYGITVDQNTGTLYVSDYYNHMIRKITAQGEVSTVAGNGKSGYSDGIGKSAQFSGPYGICLDEKEQALAICDYNNHKIRRLDIKSGEVKTICEINSPGGITIAPNGCFIVTSRNHHKVILITHKDGKHETKTLAGSGIQGHDDGAALLCKFNYPSGVSFDSKSNTCFVVDYSNHRIRKFTLI